MKNKLNSLFVLSCVLCVLTLSGCDQIKDIGQYFSKSKKPAASNKVPVVSTVLTPKAKGPMAANELARVGDWGITIEDFEDRLKALKEVVPEYDIKDKEARALVLEELVRQQLLVIDAETSGLAKQKDILDAVEEFHRTLIVREVARTLTENISVTDEEARTFYEQRKDLLVNPGKWRVREIKVATEEKAKEVLIEILKGTDFTQMAQTHSTSESAANGGDLGFIDDVPFPQMANALLSLDVGDVSSVFEGPDGFFIIKLEEKQGGGTIAFEELKEEIKNNQLIFKQQQAILDYIEGLKQKTKIEINESLL